MLHLCIIYVVGCEVANLTWDYCLKSLIVDSDPTRNLATHDIPRLWLEFSFVWRTFSMTLDIKEADSECEQGVSSDPWDPAPENTSGFANVCFIRCFRRPCSSSIAHPHLLDLILSRWLLLALLFQTCKSSKNHSFMHDNNHCRDI